MLIQMRRLLGGAVAVACLFSTFVTLAAPAAHAQQELIEADPDVVRARAEVQAAQLAAHQAANQLEQATQQRDSTQASIDEHVAHLADLDAQRAALAAQREVLKADLRQRAISLYRAGGSSGRLEALNADNAVDAARRARLGDIAARTTQRASQQLEDTRVELGKVQDTLRAEESDLRQQKASLDSQVAQQERLQTVMAQKVDAANAALGRARALGALRAAGDPVMGPSLLTADQLVRWYNAQSYRPRLETSIDDLAGSSSKRATTRASAATSRSRSRSWRPPVSTPHPRTTTPVSVGATAAPPETGSRTRVKVCGRRSSCS